ncbi:unnamed protein product [Owenia fusiformis]|uniref:beta-glucosidase n=1 Tax=Owenia fusiformis TaxID=6347 RepID=A0A8S4NYG1_OWEFU|nr:unnamed protein product [Owenia fusiformis]
MQYALPSTLQLKPRGRRLTQILVFQLWCHIAVATQSDDEFYYGDFPEDFIWSSATSSYQIEGGWNASGKGVNIWDTFCHSYNGKVEGNATGDIACDSFNNWRQDVEMLKFLGVQFYRFSISWARIFPDGTNATINEAGIKYYSDLIDALIAANIKPFVTLYHWDLPQTLQDFGGWENETMIEYFNQYAIICFQRYGDRVKHWLTFNEPWVVAWQGYGEGSFAPGIVSPGVAVYKAGHTMIKAHAKAYHTYNDTFRASQKGVISITLNTDFKSPKNTSNPLDVAAGERCLQFSIGWFAHAIFKNGDYPEIMKEQVRSKSLAQGYNASRLPVFTEADQAYIKGTHDFFGLNTYTTQAVEHYVDPNSATNTPSYMDDQDRKESFDPSWPTSGASWLRMVPWGIRRLLNWLKNEYNDPEIFITENGISDRNATSVLLQDSWRVNFYNQYINNVLKAIRKDNVNVRAYTAWSLMDNFEWGRGYEEHYGLYYVDMSDPKRPRTAKDSAKWYKKMIADNGFKKNSSGAKINTGTLFNVIALSVIATLAASK